MCKNKTCIKNKKIKIKKIFNIKIGNEKKAKLLRKIEKNLE